MNTYRRTLSLLMCLLPLLLGCRKSNDMRDTGPMSIVRTTPVETNAVPEDILIASDPEFPVATAPAYTETSILRTQRAILRLYNLKAGQPVAVLAELRDEAHSVIHTNKIEAVPTESSLIFWDDFLPDYHTNKAGHWTWSMKVRGKTEYKVSVSVLPPTPAEADRLARHEQARETTLRALGACWLARGEHLFTKIGVEDPMYLQVRDHTSSMRENSTTRADQLNGISYRGKVSLSFPVFRLFSELKGGWTEWQSFDGSDGDLQSLLARRLGANGKVGLNALLRLEFELMQRDGNWSVWTPTGERYVNGKRVEGNPGPLFAPTGSEVERLLVQGHVPFREKEKSLGDSVKENPGEVDRDLIETMRILRGHLLR